MICCDEPKVMGALDRPKILTLEVQQSIVNALAAGSYLQVACKAAGITRQTFEYWKRLCDAGAEHAQVYADFFASCDMASAIAEINAITAMRSGAPGVWQGNAKFLQLRFHKRWGNKDKVPDAPKPHKPLSEMTVEELDEYERNLGRKG